MALLGGTMGRGALLALCKRASANGTLNLARTTANTPGRTLHTKRQNELYNELGKLFSQSSTGVPALLLCCKG